MRFGLLHVCSQHELLASTRCIAGRVGCTQCLLCSCLSACIAVLTMPPLLLQPVQLHGSLGREAATGRGTVFAIRELLKATQAGNIANKTYVIQVLHWGSHLARVQSFCDAKSARRAHYNSITTSLHMLAKRHVVSAAHVPE